MVARSVTIEDIVQAVRSLGGDVSRNEEGMWFFSSPKHTRWVSPHDPTLLLENLDHEPPEDRQTFLEELMDQVEEGLEPWRWDQV